MLRRFMVERDMRGIGKSGRAALGAAAMASNRTLARLSSVQWQQSFVAEDKTFCVYLADSEEAIREHARLSGIPATRITAIPTVLDPTDERWCLAQATN